MSNGVLLDHRRGTLGWYGSQPGLCWGDNTSSQTNVPPLGTNVVALAAGDYHCLALHQDGTVTAWGANYFGQTNVPSGLTNVVGIAAGSASSMALRADGTVAVWGAIGPDDIITVPSNVTNVVAIAAGPGAQHSLVLRADGSLVDWGDPNYGLTNIPPNAENIVGVAAGSTFAVALRADGTLVTWGQGPAIPSNATNIVEVVAGWKGAAALRADGNVLAWGTATYPTGSAGYTKIVDLSCPFNNTFASSVLALQRTGTMVEWPIAPSGTQAIPAKATNIVAVAAGSYDALALAGSGPPVFPGMPVNRTVDAGRNAFFRMSAVGALPLIYQWQCNGTNIPNATNSFLAFTNVQPAQAGNYYAVTVTNTLGTNTSLPMTLNVNPLEAFIQPQTVSTVYDGTVTFTATTIGQGPFTYQWQFNGTNLLNATNSVLSLTNVLAGNAGAYSVIVGNAFGSETNSSVLTLAPTIVASVPKSQTIFPNGTVTLSIGVQAIIPVTYQWLFNGTIINGANGSSLILTNMTYGQSGLYTVIFTDAYEAVTNSATVSVVPVAAWGEFGQWNMPSGYTNLLAVACGEESALGLNSDGTVIAWGNSFIPVPAGLTNIIAIAAGSGDSLALCSNGTVMSWGFNDYGLTNVPPGLTNVVAIAAGDFDDLALKSDGTVAAWGNNQYGQTNLPPGLTNVVAIAAGEWNCMALRADGTVVAWGAGTNNTGTDPFWGQSMVPASLSNVVQIATGGLDDIALKSDNSFSGWGANSYGEDTFPSGLSNIVAIAGGYGFSVALKVDGTVAAWGSSELGVAIVPAGLTNVTAISSSGFETLALVANGPPPTQVTIYNPQLMPSGFSLSLPTQSGHVYRLEYKNSLSDSNWIPFPLTAGTGATLTISDSSAASSGQRFYRVSRW